MGPLVVLDLYVRDPRTLTSLDRADVQDVARRPRRSWRSR
jgi:hypothetical protein